MRWAFDAGEMLGRSKVKREERRKIPNPWKLGSGYLKRGPEVSLLGSIPWALQ
jgi:hypothetical protein